jgi:hypothetical protein
MRSWRGSRSGSYLRPRLGTRFQRPARGPPVVAATPAASTDSRLHAYQRSPTLQRSVRRLLHMRNGHGLAAAYLDRHHSSQMHEYLSE